MNMLIADTFSERSLTELRDAGYKVDYAPGTAGEALQQRVRDVQVLVVRSTKVDHTVIDNAPGLALILRAGAGYDTIDVEAASARGIFVSNCPGKNSVAVAELTIGLILALDRRIPAATHDLRAGKWNKKEYSKASGLKGRTLGLCGMGPIGRAVAQRALAFEMPVVAWSRSLTPEQAEELGVERCASILEVAARSDIVSVHMAQTAETKKLFGKDFFAHMKRDAMFINTSRGGLHDQSALAEAMKTKGIRAGLDVFDPEPTTGTADFSDPIFASPNFVGTHHIGASTDQAQDAIAAEAVRICREFIATGRAPNVVNVEQRPPAKCQLIVRHYDRVGVLAAVLGIIRNYGVNVGDMTNTIFQGAKAAVAVIRISAEPSSDLLAEIAALKGQVIQVEAKPA